MNLAPDKSGKVEKLHGLWWKKIPNSDVEERITVVLFCAFLADFHSKETIHHFVQSIHHNNGYVMQIFCPFYKTSKS